MEFEDEILKRFKKAQSRKSNWADLYEDAQTYAAPHRENFDEGTEVNPGQNKNGKNKVFDSTAIDATQKFASNLQSSLTPPMRQFLELKPGPQLKENKKFATLLSEINDVLFSSLSNSNFDTQIAEAYQDLAVGTGAILVFPGDISGPFRFSNVPLSQLFLEEGPDGRIETAFRKWMLSARNIEATWEDAKISKELAEKIKEKPEEQVDIIEATFPADVEITRPDGTFKGKGYKYVVIEEKSKKKIVEREYLSSPWIIFRWSTLPGEIYGRGPLLIALPDIKTLNKTKELLLKSASISIFGMWTGVDDGTINLENIKFSPGTIIPVAANAGGAVGPTIAPLAPPGDPNLASMVISDLQDVIRNMLFADPLGPINLPVKSATEMSLRQQELAKRIGASFGRLQFELIQPLVNRLLDILDELGLIDLGEFRVDGNVIAIEHVSPLAQAQAEEEVLAIGRYMELIAGMYGPEALATALPLEKFVSNVAPRLNIPQDMIPDEQEIQQQQQLGQAVAAASELGVDLGQ